jgi:hypothetical protein
MARKIDIGDPFRGPDASVFDWLEYPDGLKSNPTVHAPPIVTENLGPVVQLPNGQYGYGRLAHIGGGVGVGDRPTPLERRGVAVDRRSVPPDLNFQPREERYFLGRGIRDGPASQRTYTYQRPEFIRGRSVGSEEEAGFEFGHSQQTPASDGGSRGPRAFSREPSFQSPWENDLRQSEEVGAGIGSRSRLIDERDLEAVAINRHSWRVDLEQERTLLPRRSHSTERAPVKSGGIREEDRAYSHKYEGGRVELRVEVRSPRDEPRSSVDRSPLTGAPVRHPRSPRRAGFLGIGTSPRGGGSMSLMRDYGNERRGRSLEKSPRDESMSVGKAELRGPSAERGPRLVGSGSRGGGWEKEGARSGALKEGRKELESDGGKGGRVDLEREHRGLNGRRSPREGGVSDGRRSEHREVSRGGSGRERGDVWRSEGVSKDPPRRESPRERGGPYAYEKVWQETRREREGDRREPTEFRREGPSYKRDERYMAGRDQEQGEAHNRSFSPKGGWRARPSPKDRSGGADFKEFHKDGDRVRESDRRDAFGPRLSMRETEGGQRVYERVNVRTGDVRPRREGLEDRSTFGGSREGQKETRVRSRDSIIHKWGDSDKDTSISKAGREGKRGDGPDSRLEGPGEQSRGDDGRESGKKDFILWRSEEKGVWKDGTGKSEIKRMDRSSLHTEEEWLGVVPGKSTSLAKVVGKGRQKGVKADGGVKQEPISKGRVVPTDQVPCRTSGQQQGPPENMKQAPRSRATAFTTGQKSNHPESSAFTLFGQKIEPTLPGAHSSACKTPETPSPEARSPEKFHNLQLLPNDSERSASESGGLSRFETRVGKWPAQGLQTGAVQSSESKATQTRLEDFPFPTLARQIEALEVHPLYPLIWGDMPRFDSELAPWGKDFSFRVGGKENESRRDGPGGNTGSANNASIEKGVLAGESVEQEAQGRFSNAESSPRGLLMGNRQSHDVERDFQSGLRMSNAFGREKISVEGVEDKAGGRRGVHFENLQRSGPREGVQNGFEPGSTIGRERPSVSPGKGVKRVGDWGEAEGGHRLGSSPKVPKVGGEFGDMWGGRGVPATGELRWAQDLEQTKGTSMLDNGASVQEVAQRGGGVKDTQGLREAYEGGGSFGLVASWECQMPSQGLPIERSLKPIAESQDGIRDVVSLGLLDQEESVPRGSAERDAGHDLMDEDMPLGVLKSRRVRKNETAKKGPAANVYQGNLRGTHERTVAENKASAVFDAPRMNQLEGEKGHPEKKRAEVLTRPGAASLRSISSETLPSAPTSSALPKPMADVVQLATSEPKAKQESTSLKTVSFGRALTAPKREGSVAAATEGGQLAAAEGGQLAGGGEGGDSRTCAMCGVGPSLSRGEWYCASCGKKEERCTCARPLRAKKNK